MFFKIKENHSNLKKLKEIVKTISKSYHFKIRLTVRKPSDFGRVFFDDNMKNIQVQIGVMDYLFQKDPTFNFVRSLIILYHELQHVKQNEDIQNGVSSPEMFYNVIAISKNQDYYLQNYNFDLREMDANYVGIHKAYERIKKEYPEINIFENIKKYMLEHSFFQDYFPKIKMASTMEEIDAIFDEMLERIPQIPKSIERCTSEISKSHKPDEFLKHFTDYCNEHDINYPNILIKAKYHSDANFLSDKVIGRIMLDKYPEYQELAIKNHIQVDPLDKILEEFTLLGKMEIEKD